jgi:hypothetical protein
MNDLMWLSFVLGLTILALVYVRALAAEDEGTKP